jgi:tetratricopeptide (TPR) repeat protein
MEKADVLVIARTGLVEKLLPPLTAKGWQVHVCTDVRTAVDTTLRVRPDVILCEDDTAIMSGWELARLFKSHDSLGRVPFLLVSSRMPPLADMERAGFRVSADDLIELPADLGAVVSRVEAWMAGPDRPLSLPQRLAGPLAPNGMIQAIPWRRGKLSPASLARLLLHLANFGESGVLRLKGERRQLKILVQSRSVVEIESNYLRDDTFGRYLAQLGVLTEEDGDRAFAVAIEKNITQSQAMVQMNLLQPNEADQYVARQKIEKVLQAFSPIWTGSAFHFMPERLTQRRFSIDPVPLIEILKNGLLTYADPLELAHILARNRGDDEPFRRADIFDRAVADLRLAPELRALGLELVGKTVGQIRQAPAESDDTQLRLAFLLTAAGGLQFDAPAPSVVQPQAADGEWAQYVIQPVGAERYPEWDLEAFENNLLEGRTLFNREDYRGAQHFLDRVLEINSDSSEGLALKAWCMFELSGRQDISVTYEAKEMLKLAITYDDSNDEAYLFLGRIFKSEGKDSLAGAYFRRANEVNPANEEARREVKLLQVKRRRAREWERR